MKKRDASMLAGLNLRRLIYENYSTQEEFSLDYGMELRTVSRYITKGINKVDAIQELAVFFNVPFTDFFIDGQEPIRQKLS